MSSRTWRETHEKSWNRWLERQRSEPEPTIDLDRFFDWLKVVNYVLFLLGILLLAIAKAVKNEKPRNY